MFSAHLGDAGMEVAGSTYWLQDLLLISAGATFSLVVGETERGALLSSTKELSLLLAVSSSSGSVTPGIVGRLQGGLSEWGELRHWSKNFLSYTILVP
ncbi:hypothetical protein EB796_018281 [Bugula neritina]|uniref:Uncharacterized protein n=1 Tax=Bugula neritina TaxID=10212 RepID=A0A7J7JBG7_BUGNE|nr:hypothetical protein EB796_018281 [Bugula neritina]